MHKLYQTVATGEVKDNPAAAFELTANGPVIVMSRATPKVVMVAPEQWNQIAAKLRRLEAIVEAHKLEAATNEANSWIPWDVTKARMAANAALAD